MGHSSKAKQVPAAQMRLKLHFYRIKTFQTFMEPATHVSILELRSGVFEYYARIDLKGRHNVFYKPHYLVITTSHTCGPSKQSLY